MPVQFDTKLERWRGELLEPLERGGAKAPHLAWFLRNWLSGTPLCLPEPGSELPFPRTTEAGFHELAQHLENLLRPHSVHPSEDGGERLLTCLHDGRTVESVLLARAGVCVSTQIGCAVGCTFCMTGRSGLVRQLTVPEILAQVVLARRKRALRRVLFMGMGEPAHNLLAVRGALDALGTEGGFGHKELVFSTVGDPQVFEQLAGDRVRPALALSLHSTNAACRARLIPRAPEIDPSELFEAALVYSTKTGHPLQLQWTLLAGVNDGEAELETLLSWVSGKRVIVNFIPFNKIPDSPFHAPNLARQHAMLDRLRGSGIRATLRLSVAGDVDGACGQLRARVL